MSVLHAGAPYRRDDRASLRVPVVMPLVEVTIDQAGKLDVHLDREPYSVDGALQREDLSRVLTEIANDLGTPARVEIREPDGSTFTDIVTPSLPTPAPAAEPKPNTALFSAFGIAGDGFAPGEEVAVAVIVARQLANENGTAQLRLPPALLADRPGVVLFGRTSGTIALGDGTP